MQLAQAPTATLMQIPEGVDGIRATLRLMRQLTRAGKISLPVLLKAREITGELRQKDFPGEIRALHRFVRDSIRYVRDVRDVETLQTPDRTLEFESGDCDDKAVLLASLLESIGHKTRFVAVAFSPDDYRHVLLETRLGNRWLPLETTEPVRAGWYPRNVSNRLVIHN